MFLLAIYFRITDVSRSANHLYTFCILLEFTVNDTFPTSFFSSLMLLSSVRFWNLVSLQCHSIAVLREKNKFSPISNQHSVCCSTSLHKLPIESPFQVLVYFCTSTDSYASEKLLSLSSNHIQPIRNVYRNKLKCSINHCILLMCHAHRYTTYVGIYLPPSTKLPYPALFSIR